MLAACAVLSAALTTTLASGETAEQLPELEPKPVKEGPASQAEPEEVRPTRLPVGPVGASARIAAALGAGVVLVAALAVGGRIFARGRSAGSKRRGER